MLCCCIASSCWENEELNRKFFSRIKARYVDRINRIMIGVCSPYIGNERDIFLHVQFHFRMNEIFKFKVYLIQKLKDTKGSSNI